MTSQEFNIKRFNRKNFQTWKFRIETAAEKLVLQEYLEKDIIEEIKEKRINKNLETARKENATIKELMINSMEDDILKDYLNVKSYFTIMNRLKRKNGGDKNDLKYWIKKLNSLKVKTLNEVTNNLDEMFDVFELMKEINLTLSDNEKLKFMYKESMRNRL